MSGSSAAAAVDDDDGGAGNSDGLLHVRGASAPGRGRRGLGSCRREPSNAVGYDNIERRAVRAPGTRRSYVRPSVRLVSVHVRARRPSAPRSPRERARLLSTSTWLGVAWGVVRSVHAAHAPHRIAPHRIQDSRTPGGRPSSLPLVLASRRGGLGARGCGRVRAGVTGSGRGVAVEARGARRTGGLLTAAHLCAWTRACGGWSGEGHAGRGTRGQIGRPDAYDTADAVAVCRVRGDGERRTRETGRHGRAGRCRAVHAGIARAGTGFVGGLAAVRAQAEEGLRRTRKGVGTLETDELLMVCWRARREVM